MKGGEGRGQRGEGRERESLSQQGEKQFFPFRHSLATELQHR
jgi:hypothetical protein